MYPNLIYVYLVTSERKCLFNGKLIQFGNSRTILEFFPGDEPWSDSRLMVSSEGKYLICDRRHTSTCPPQFSVWEFAATRDRIINENDTLCDDCCLGAIMQLITLVFIVWMYVCAYLCAYLCATLVFACFLCICVHVCVHICSMHICVLVCAHDFLLV